MKLITSSVDPGAQWLDNGSSKTADSRQTEWEYEFRRHWKPLLRAQQRFLHAHTVDVTTAPASKAMDHAVIVD